MTRKFFAFIACALLLVPAVTGDAQAAATRAQTDRNLQWYAPGETRPTCNLANKACPCNFGALVAALSHTWGQPIGRGGRDAAAKILSLFRETQRRSRLAQKVSLRPDADAVASFARHGTLQQLTVLGKNGCATQTVNWTPYGLIVLNFEQFAILSSIHRNPAPAGNSRPH